MKSFLKLICFVFCLCATITLSACNEGNLDGNNSTMKDTSTTIEDSTANDSSKDAIERTITLACDKGEVNGQTSVIIEFFDGMKGEDIPTPILQARYYTNGSPEFRFKGWMYGERIISSSEELVFVEEEVTLTAVWVSYWLGPY